MTQDRWNMVVAAALAVLVLGSGGCTTTESVRAYVSGWDGTTSQSRATLAEFEEAGQLEIVHDLEAEELDYVVLAPLPDDPPRSAPVADAEESDLGPEVLDRMNWFAMLDAHENAQLRAREREIPTLELQPFIEMLQARTQTEAEAEAEEVASDTEAAAEGEAEEADEAEEAPADDPGDEAEGQ